MEKTFKIIYIPNINKYPNLVGQTCVAIVTGEDRNQAVYRFQIQYAGEYATISEVIEF